MKTGVEKGILYPKNSPAVVWNGLKSVTEIPSDSDVIVAYYDGEKYVQERGTEGFTAVIEAFTYPDVIDAPYYFGLSYTVLKDDSYEIHLVYNATAYNRDSGYIGLSKNVEISNFKWSITTVPIKIPGAKACSHLVIDAAKTHPGVLLLLEDILFGGESTEPRLPTPGEVIDLFEVNAIFRIIDNGDGTWTAIGPDSWINMLDATTFEITSPSAIFIDEDTYKISSW